MDGFEKRRNNKKEIILQTALELFNQFGFEKVSVVEIAEKAHVSKVSIYNFFESKDNLRRIVIKGILDKTIEDTATLVKKECEFTDKISEYLKNRIANGAKYSMNFIFNGIESDPVVRRYLEDFNVENKRLVVELIQEGKKNGYFSADVTDAAIEIYIDVFYNYFLNNRQIRQKFESIPNLAEEVSLLFTNGLMRHG